MAENNNISQGNTTDNSVNNQNNTTQPEINTVGDSILNNQELASPMEKILWYCAGADSRLLIQCMNSDRVKYQGLGGIVLATGLLAFIAMTFAINVIFFDGNWEGGISSIVVPLSIGLLWGLIIFNLDRFIVSSTGKGDGTDKITSSEIIGALPRILMAFVIAMSISAPLEIVIFEKEINKRFTEINEQKFNVQKEAFQESNASDIKIFEDQIKIKLSEKSEQDAIFKKNEDKVAYEISHGGCKGKCDEFKTLMNKAEEKGKVLKSEIDVLQSKVDKINTERDLKLKKFDEKMNEKPKLLERLLLLEEIPGASIPVWMLRLLFIVIEVGPLFFKMMLTKSTYDHLKHHYDEMVLARFGIFEDEAMIPGNNDGIAEKFYVYGNVSLLQHQNKITLDEQQRIDQQVLSMWQNYISKEMTDNPQRFVTWLQQNTGNTSKTETAIVADVDNSALKSSASEKNNNTEIPNTKPETSESTIDDSKENGTDANKEVKPIEPLQAIPTSTVSTTSPKPTPIALAPNELLNSDGTKTIVPDVNEPLDLII
jgi:hypothetical protein